MESRQNPINFLLNYTEQIFDNNNNKEDWGGIRKKYDLGEKVRKTTGVLVYNNIWKLRITIIGGIFAQHSPLFLFFLYENF